MSFQNKHTYSAFVYESDKHYFADCLSLNVISTGESPVEAIENLEYEVKKILKGQKFSLNPLYEKR